MIYETADSDLPPPLAPGHYIYMLLCRGNRIYTGYTNKPVERYKKHLSGKGAKFTRAFPPEKMLLCLSRETKSSAMKTETIIKGLGRKGKEDFIALNESDNLAEQVMASVPPLS